MQLCTRILVVLFLSFFFPKRSTAHRSSDGISFQNFLFVIDDSGFRAAAVGVYRKCLPYCVKKHSLYLYSFDRRCLVFVFVGLHMPCTDGSLSVHCHKHSWEGRGSGGAPPPR